MGEQEEPTQVPFTVALRCGWLNDPEWLINFESLVRRFHSVGSELSQNHSLPGYPFPMQAGNVFNAYSPLAFWIERSLKEFPKKLAEHPTFGVEAKILRAWMWAASLVAHSKLKDIPAGTNPASLPDRSWIPTQAELESWRGILDLLSSFDFEASPIALENEKAGRVSPGRDETTKRLRDRLELILTVFGQHGAGPFRAKKVGELAQVNNDSHLRSDLSTLRSLGFLDNSGQGYTRTDKPYPMS
jgi:hypothetical protein